MKKLLVLYLCLFLWVGVFFHINSSEFKMQRYKSINKNKITVLKPIYKEATDFCHSQNFANRGPYNACVEEKIIKSSIPNYNFYMDTQNFCENLTDNLADKYMCIDEVMDLVNF